MNNAHISDIPMNHAMHNAQISATMMNNAMHNASLHVSVMQGCKVMQKNSVTSMIMQMYNAFQSKVMSFSVMHLT